MAQITVAGIAVENTVYHFDKIFEYIMPACFNSAQAGCRALVPFGNGNKTSQGMIMYIASVDSTAAKGYKSIISVLDQTPVLPPSLLGLVTFMKERCYCTFYDCIRAMLPVGINYKITYTYSLIPNLDYSDCKLSQSEQMVVQFLFNAKKPLKKEEITAAVSVADDSLLNKMSKNGLLARDDFTSRKVNDATQKMVRVTAEEPNCKLTPKQREVAEVIRMSGGVAVKEVCYFTGTTAAVVSALVKKNVAEFYNQEVFREPHKAEKEDNLPLLSLTPQQSAAYNDLLQKYNSGKGCVSLLYGVTGSGKTSVFMKLIDKVYKDGKGVIVMVPEISLTPQLIQLFSTRYGSDVAVFHSGLSLGERLDEWKRVRNGLAKIAIGTRSAVFAPFENLGLIIMDEEQEYTYKSETTPRYHARDVAKYRCNSSNCLLLLSSATPSVETYYNCSVNRYSLNRLSQRYGKAQLPKVTVADMNIEQEQGNFTGISSPLLQALQDNIETGRQSILLLNRRGYNTFVSCKNCQEVVSCPNCSISLTYHSANNRLMCHYCGYSRSLDDECPTCHSHGLKLSGAGTQKAVETVAGLLPGAKILRLDTDTTLAKYSHEKKLAAFANGEYHIMVGTQMVAKGLNFPNVTLVGVLSVDQMLYSDDYRSCERSFSLLTQVVGRSGRGNLAGRAVIQTFTPENPIIMLAAEQNYDKFYAEEIQLRHAMLYPPYVDICMIGFVGQNQRVTQKAAFAFTENLVKTAKKNYSTIPLRVLGSTAASISKMNNKFRYKTILKFKNSKEFREMLSSLLCQFGKSKEFKDVSVYADINPDSIL